MNKPNLNETIVQIISENPPPSCLSSLSIDDINRIVSLCEKYKFTKANRSEFANKLESEIMRILSPR